MRAVPLLLLLIVLTTACGRTDLIAPPLAPDGGTPTRCARFAGLTMPLQLLEASARHATFGDAGLLLVTEPGREAIQVALPGFTGTRLATDVDDAEWLGSEGAVLLLGRGGALQVLGGRQLIDATCAHAATADGSAVFAVTQCDVQGHGTLSRIEVASGARQVLAERVLSFSLRLDAQRLASVTGGGDDPRCFWGSSRCEVRTLAGVLLSTSDLGCHHPVVTERGDVLALRQAPGCADVTVQDLLIRRGGGAGFEVLAPQVNPGPLPRWETDLSPDHRTLLAQRGRALLAVDLDDGGTRLLATGVTSAEVDATLRRFTSSGQHVAFLAGSSLRSVPLDGGSGRELTVGAVTMEAAWPGTEELLTIRDGALALRDAVTGQGTVLTALRGEAQLLAVLPEGRGVVWMESVPSQGVALRSVDRTGARTELGGWDLSHLTAPVVDGEGCAVVFDSNRGDGGTRLVPLPR